MVLFCRPVYSVGFHSRASRCASAIWAGGTPRSRSLQLWINLPAANKMTAPRYQDLVAKNLLVRRELGVEIRIFSGASGGISAADEELCAGDDGRDPPSMQALLSVKIFRPTTTLAPSYWKAKAQSALR
jgi:hypothetical protein